MIRYVIKFGILDIPQTTMNPTIKTLISRNMSYFYFRYTPNIKKISEELVISEIISKVEEISREITNNYNKRGNSRSSRRSSSCCWC